MNIKYTKVAQLTTLGLALLFTPHLFAFSLFDVTHVELNDHLNMRSAAGVGSKVVAIIPANAKGIEYLEQDKKIGTTTWSLINWQGTKGWVSQYYLMPVKVAPSTTTEIAKVVTKEEKNPTLKKKAFVKKRVQVSSQAKKTGEDVWVLRCGNKAPFWKVDVHPKWLKIQQGSYKTGLVITDKKQDRNRWNTAIKTVVEGRKGRNKLKLTIKYAYSKRCYDTLTGLRVPYKVMTEFNGETMNGCCRAIKLSAENASETLQSLASR